MIIGAAGSRKGNASHYFVHIANKAGNKSNIYNLPIHKTLTMHDQPEFKMTVEALTDSRLSSVDTVMTCWSEPKAKMIIRWYSKGWLFHVKTLLRLRTPLKFLTLVISQSLNKSAYVAILYYLLM